MQGELRFGEVGKSGKRTLVDTQILKRQLCVQVGAFLEYPVNDFREMLQISAGQIEPVSWKASSYLKDFFARMKRMELEMWQEYYVQTFDLMPRCSLYISVHLFGEESFKRAELMAGLKSAYERQGALETTELPDHLAVILKQNILLNDEEWSEFVAMCILPALPVMISKLEKNGNPYAFVLKTIQELLVEVEKAHV
jgi:nitrate reductase molybdenum cofactor assembly chaperone